MRKFFRVLHKWLSIPAGLIIFIICLSGTMLVFQDEIQEWANPQRYFHEQTHEVPLPLEELILKANKQMTDNQVKNVKIYADPAKNYAMGLAKGFRLTAYVNPYTGQIVEVYSPKESPFFWIMSLHRWLLDDTRTWGKYSVGIATLLFIVILISGFVIWFPKRGKKNKFLVETQKGSKRFYYDLHHVLGAYAFLVLLISAVTGTMWSFDWYRNGVYKLLGAEIPQQRSPEKTKKNRDAKVAFSSWQKVVDELCTLNSDHEYVVVENGKALVHQKKAPTSRASDKYKFDQQSGKIVSVELYNQQSYSSKIAGWYHDLHVGSYWGIWSKIFTFVAGLIGTSLPLTGYYIWWRKVKKKKSVLQKNNLKKSV
ncbi:MAG: PepSY-associated TM helix domain-containing protein [Paludibacter sp.]|nr:PepSY-associated TM helix domain-containing protein [Paludibacter sp.]